MDPAYHICARAALNTPELVANFDRLWGFKKPGSPLDRMIDDAAGAAEARAKAFAEFVRDCVYSRLGNEALASLREQATRVAARMATEPLRGTS